MELDELKSHWQEQDKKLDDCLRLNQRLLRESLLGKADTALRRLSRLLWFELLVNVAGAILVGSFLGDHVTEPRYLVPAIALQLGLIAVIVAGARQLAMIAGIDYAAPIVEIQRRLEILWLQRIRTTQWMLILSPLAWTPLAIVGFKWLLNVDVYCACGTPFGCWNLVFRPAGARDCQSGSPATSQSDGPFARDPTAASGRWRAEPGSGAGVREIGVRVRRCLAELS